MSQLFTKDPEDILDYSVDFTEWLQPTEVINSVDWTLPTGLTLVADTFGDKIATAWISGGVVGSNYTAQCQITTNSNPNARVKNVRIYFNVLLR